MDTQRAIRVLVVDDEREFCQALEDALSREQDTRYELSIATTVAGARQAVRESRRPFDALLIDQVLPREELNGIALMKELRGASPGSEAIVFTGFATREDGLRALREGAYRYLHKGSDWKLLFEELIIQVRSLVESRETRRQKDWLQMLKRIGDKINRQSVPRTERELGALLEVIRQQVGQAVDVSSFYICLLDWEAKEMRFRLHYERGERRKSHRRQLQKRQGLTAHVAFSDEMLLLSHGTEQFYKKHNLRVIGQPARSWLGVPIRHEGRVLGVMTVQDYEREAAYTQEQCRLLEAIADQAAAAIANAHLSLQAHRSAQQMDALQYVSREMLTLAPTDLDKMLHVVLTATTARYGLGLNRAMLFLLDEGAFELRGRMGIGHLQERQARRDWEQDEREEMDFQKYLAQYADGTLRYSPLHDEATRLTIPLGGDDVFTQVVRSKQSRRVILRREFRRVPEAFRRALEPQREMALLPLQASDKVIGVLVVDNKFSRRPIDDETLSRLQTFVNQAALVIENARTQRDELKRQVHLLEALNQVQKAIIGIGSEADLDDVLESVVEQAMRALRDVDAITLYHLDRENDTLQLGGIDGVQDTADIKTGPYRPESVVGRVLRLDGPRFAPNTPGDVLLSGPFVRRENIRSTAAFPLEYGQERVGCMFFNYRHPHEFDEDEKNVLQLFAQQAALAIHKATLYNEAERRRRHFETVARITPIVNATLDPDQVVRAILTETLRVVPRARQACMLHYDPETQDLTFSPVSFEFYHIDPTRQREGRARVQANERSIAGRVARTGEPANVPDVRADPDYLPLVGTTQSELCVPIKVGEKLLGVLVLESDQSGAFTDDDQSLLEALADQVAVALNQAQEHSQLKEAQGKLAASSAVAWMGIFGSNWSHTVNQRTYQIENRVHHLKKALAPLPTQVEGWLNAIEKATGQLKAHPLPGKLPAQSQSGTHGVQIDAVLRKHVKRWCNKRSDIELQLDLNCNGTRVPIQEGWLEIPLEKLINNALKAMPGKGKLTVRSARHGSQVEVQVQDTGQGIPENIVKGYLFSRPVPKSTAEAGSGLGLLIARMVLEAHSGDMKLLRTATGQGTTFVFRLPVSEPDRKGE
jgi:GAF domain-containing protein/ActR/RegA family two-component response regulator